MRRWHALTRSCERGMIGSLSRTTPVIVQGITGRMGRTHAGLMRAYGTNIVGGTSTRTDIRRSCGCAGFRILRRRGPGHRRGRFCRDGAAGGNLAAGAGGADRGDQTDRDRCGRSSAARRDEDRPGGPSRRRHLDRSVHARPGHSGRIKLGFLPDVCLAPGPFAIMSKSGTLSYEVGYRLAHEGLGQSIWVGVGGDPVKGVRFADLLPVFFDDAAHARRSCWSAKSAAARKRSAPMLASAGARKPLFALIAGREAKEGVSMGHAGALVMGESGTLASKTQRLTAAGARVFGSIGSDRRGLCGRFRSAWHMMVRLSVAIALLVCACPALATDDATARTCARTA